MNESTRNYLILLTIIIIFAAQCLYFNFTQDDAFISYRYVKNFTSGNGLVFNSGERVEGYTNFLWIIVLSIFSELGLNIIVISKILGQSKPSVIMDFYEHCTVPIQDEASSQTTHAMANFLANLVGIPLNEAGMSMYLVGQLKFCQVVYPQRTVRFEFPKWVLAEYGFRMPV